MKTILHVDDEHARLKSVARMLIARGYKVISAVYAEQALDVLRETHIDAMLLDVKMPGINGLQLLEVVHMLQPRLPIIMLTGDGNDEVLFASVRFGSVGFLEKPFAAEDLVAEIEGVLCPASDCA